MILVFKSQKIWDFKISLYVTRHSLIQGAGVDLGVGHFNLKDRGFMDMDRNFRYRPGTGIHYINTFLTSPS